MDLHLLGKRALVTGASKGLGYATALGLLREGAQVVINSRSPEGVQSAVQTLQKAVPGCQVSGFPGDVTEPDFPARLVEEAVNIMGGLDLLFTNAGGPAAGRFENLDEPAWEKAVDLSLMCHVRLIRCALPYLRQSETPSVLTNTSVSVIQPIANLVLSNSVRAATVGLTKSLALELGPEGIRFNSILPGWTETERVGYLMENRAKSNGTTVEQEIKKLTDEIPLGRMGQPEEFANTAVFLLSPAASYVTGVMLNVDGGSYKGLL